MYYYFYSALWTSLLFSAVNIDVLFAEPQLPEETDLSFSGSDTLGDSYLDSDIPVGSNLDDFTVPSSFESASLLPTTSSVDSMDTLFPQDDLFADEIAAADCPSAGIDPKNKFRTRQACVETPHILPEVKTPEEDTGLRKDESFPEDLGLFEPYNPFAYGEKDEDSCPPALFGARKYSVCDSGNRDMFSIVQSGYANLQYCKPAYKYLDCPNPSWKWCCEGAREVGTERCRAFGCVPADPNHQWFDRFGEGTLVPF